MDIAGFSPLLLSALLFTMEAIILIIIDAITGWGLMTEWRPGFIGSIIIACNFIGIPITLFYLDYKCKKN